MCRITRVVSFDHLVRAGEQGRWDFEPDAFCGAEIDHQLEFRGLDDGQVGRLGTFEDAARVNADEAIRLSVDWSVTDEAADLCELAPAVQCRNPIMVGERHDLLASTEQEWIKADKQ